MKFNTLFLTMGLFLVIETRHVTSVATKEKLFAEDADFWGRVEKDYVDSFETTSAPTGPPIMIPTPIPTSKPSFTKTSK